MDGLRGPAAVAGALAAWLALGVSELLTGLVGLPSLVVSVGNLVIDHAPPWLEDTAIALLGIYDKPALVAGIVVVAGAAGALLGRMARRRPWAPVAGFLAFAALGAWAAHREAPAGPVAAGVLAALSAGAGLAALALLLRRTGDASPGPTDPRRTRRAFLRGAGLTAGAALVAGLGGRALAGDRRDGGRGREEVALPLPADPVSPPPPAAQVAGLEPVVTPNDRFFRIDTALVVPRVDLEGWRLRVTGMVERPYEVGFEELLAMPLVERYVTLACVSNEVGGDLVDNAAWLGVPLRSVLERAGVHPEATQVVARSVDGFTVGFPTEAALDGRDALVAVGMNGEPLPYQHGFPARLVVSGLYGYVSATKWLAELELTTWEAFDAYWVPRGWAKEAPIKTQSRIDTPRHGATVEAGRRAVAGVAWAPGRGIHRVEVRVDEGPWGEARLAAALSEDAWRQWVYPWEAVPGPHTLQVRATDGTGETQTARPSPPRPDGATGYHTIRVQVG